MKMGSCSISKHYFHLNYNANPEQNPIGLLNYDVTDHRDKQDHDASSNDAIKMAMS